MGETMAPMPASGREYNLIPVYREVLADLETPVSVFLKLFHEEPGAFLFESVEGGEQIARYSFLGARPLSALVHKAGYSRRLDGALAAPMDFGPLPGPGDGEAGDPLTHLRRFLQAFRVATPRPVPEEGMAPGDAAVAASQLPRFFGGAIGYLGYDAVRCYERLPGGPADDLGLPDAVFMVPRLVAIFDHLKHRLLLMVLADAGADPEAAFRRAVAILDGAVERLRGPVPGGATLAGRPGPGGAPGQAGSGAPSAGTDRATFLAAVRRIREYIAAGDAFQVVLSRRLEVPVRARPLDIYRVLRTVSPSPYMFYIRLGELRLIGASPEMLVRVEGGVAHLRPLAGTAPRGASVSEDHDLEQRLRQDEKERAEHLMLVDLGRNDLGRICSFGSVTVQDLMRVERFSHVMHLVSDLKGELAPDQDALDALAACFPAGTLTGAPKVRAMEIIDELEPTRRGPYGGAVGYFGFDGNMDTCITIRTLVMKGSRAYIQAGAGVVADSDPEREYEETLHKARAMLRTLELAERGIQP